MRITYKDEAHQEREERKAVKEILRQNPSLLKLWEKQAANGDEHAKKLIKYAN